MSRGRPADHLQQLLDGALDRPAPVSIALTIPGGKAPHASRVDKGGIAVQDHSQQQRDRAQIGFIGRQLAPLGDRAGQIAGALRLAGRQQRRERGVAQGLDRPFPTGVGARGFRSGRLRSRFVDGHCICTVLPIEAASSSITEAIRS